MTKHHLDPAVRPSSGAHPVIYVRDLTKAFSHHYALRKLSFEVNRGEFLTIFGPNGAGKTTLIRILSTLTRPSGGEVRIEGYSAANESNEIRSRLGVIAHQTFLYEPLTATENLRFYGRLYNVPNLDARIENLLDEVGLLARQNDEVRTFSRGMQQRLSIARALLHDPSVLLLDEPYTGLDQHASEMLTGWLGRLRASARTILMVTHDLERGLDLADRVAILVNGKIVFSKPSSEIQRDTVRKTYYDLVENGPGQA